MLVDDCYRVLTINSIGIQVDIADKCWLMSIWGIILPNILGIIIIQ